MESESSNVCGPSRQTSSPQGRTCQGYLDCCQKREPTVRVGTLAGGKEGGELAGEGEAGAHGTAPQKSLASLRLGRRRHRADCAAHGTAPQKSLASLRPGG